MFKYCIKKKNGREEKLENNRRQGGSFSAPSPDKAGVDDQEYQYKQLFLCNRKPIKGRAQIWTFLSTS